MNNPAVFRLLTACSHAAFIAVLGILPPAAFALGTPAGINITNVASATYTDSLGAQVAVASNTSVLRVDEILDVTLVANDAGNLQVASPRTDAALSFTLSNIGNGPETFRLTFNNSLVGDQFNPANTRIYLDNGDNIFNPATDTLYAAASNDPVLAADGTRVIFVVSDIPAGLINADIGLASVQAEAVTALATPAADAPGFSFSGQGAGGGDAVVGASQAVANAQNGYVASLLATTFAKAPVVLDQSGGSNPVPGATITYTLTFSVTGSGTLTGAQIVDPIPAASTYVPGSLRLNSAPLTDVADGDNGRFSGSQIEVVLGTVTAPATNVVTFQVTIN